jgi:hypothetical protein
MTDKPDVKKPNTYDPSSNTWVDESGHTDPNDARNSMVPVPTEEPKVKPVAPTHQTFPADTKKSK